MIWQILRKFITKFELRDLHKGFAILLILLAAGSVGYSFFESKSLTDSLWWSVVTMTTVGYGDMFPESAGGRILAVFIMTAGIGILGAITASFASFLMEKRLMELKGMKSLDIRDHIIVCGWNSRGHEIVQELKADRKCLKTKIVLIADIEESPFINDQSLFFVKGEINKETLEKACAEKAVSALVLSGNGKDTYSNDAKSILSCLTIKNFNPDIYTSVELIDTKNTDQCKIAGADEIIVSGKMTTNLLVQSILDHGIPECINELLSNRTGQEFYKMELPEKYRGKSFSEILKEMKERHDILVIGTDLKTDKIIRTNPPGDTILNEGDKLIVIAEERPD